MFAIMWDSFLDVQITSQKRCNVNPSREGITKIKASVKQ